MNKQTFFTGVINKTTRLAPDIPATYVGFKAWIFGLVRAQRNVLLKRWTNYRQQDIIWDVNIGPALPPSGRIVSDVDPFFYLMLIVCNVYWGRGIVKPRRKVNS